MIDVSSPLPKLPVGRRISPTYGYKFPAQRSINALCNRMQLRMVKRKQRGRETCEAKTPFPHSEYIHEFPEDPEMSKRHRPIHSRCEISPLFFISLPLSLFLLNGVTLLFDEEQKLREKEKERSEGDEKQVAQSMAGNYLKREKIQGEREREKVAIANDLSKK